ncbi:Hypothetical predicted protein [Pelobates cultripes]|uniref:Uncharacterized protein n=1 Tax=Pelobates cultripes TaxID=61616 RepID=A0AAD1S7E0_PELCU|nr:Hypothetical predicted protein [Pelobates cultripes]
MADRPYLCPAGWTGRGGEFLLPRDPHGTLQEQQTSSIAMGATKGYFILLCALNLAVEGNDGSITSDTVTAVTAFHAVTDSMTAVEGNDGSITSDTVTAVTAFHAVSDSMTAVEGNDGSITSHTVTAVTAFHAVSDSMTAVEGNDGSITSDTVTAVTAFHAWTYTPVTTWPPGFWEVATNVEMGRAGSHRFYHHVELWFFILTSSVRSYNTPDFYTAQEVHSASSTTTFVSQLSLAVMLQCEPLPSTRYNDKPVGGVTDRNQQITLSGNPVNMNKTTSVSHRIVKG